MKKIMFLLVLFLILYPVISHADVLVGPDEDYKSFTKAIYDTVDSGETVIVFPGVYDIKKEYEELFGEVDLVCNVDIGNNFQLGIMLHDRQVIFMPGSQLRCVWYQPIDDAHKFCPLYVHHNVKINGLNLYAEGMLYAIHDDVWMFEEPYINEYNYCKVIGQHLTNANCIGGGCGTNSRHIISNCYFDNGVDNSITVRYHNNTFPNSAGDIWINNSYFNGYLALCYQGDQTNKLDVFISGCKTTAIQLKHETIGSDENIELYQWNNH